ncbi:sulfotransferase domain-containing protein [Dactylosporangium siamense]|uniref:Sulfotransferase n=1 Tax=Dactylosporangium siamense TaxID=685454 RepID=A0A919PYY8_9ACTN|nr:sulfotransferase domain-containing protein [Dactylosporangium siamense]GIG52987.1 sulfotransferase [Dactylosporangium siamense]
MRALTWVSSYPRSGCDWTRVLVASYLLDVPAPDLDTDEADRVAPDLMDLFNHGRMVPRGDDRPYLVKTQFHPGVEALRPYREATGKVVCLVRDPRGVISSHVRAQRLAGEERRWLALWMVEQLAPVGRPSQDAGISGASGTWLQHVRDWTSAERVRRHFPHVEDVCVVRFEDLRRDPAAALRVVLEFLDVAGGVDADRVRRTVERSALRDILAAARRAPARGLAAFQDNPPPVVEVDDAELSLMDIGEDVEAAYRKRLAEERELAALVRQFGYEAG